jgi:sugar lactone lactonase YvrE
MRKIIFCMLLLIALSAFYLSFLVSPATAEVGDFLFTWGAKYNFYNTAAVAVDNLGNVYVSSSGTPIEVFSRSGELIREFWAPNSSFAGIGSHGYSRIAIGKSGKVYALSQGQVHVFDGKGNFIKKFKNYDNIDSPNFLNNPQGIAVDENENVYITENCYNPRVLVFDSDGNFLRRWGSYGSGDGQFISLIGIAVDANGSIYVVDARRIQVFDSNGNFLRKFGSLGLGDGQFGFMPYGITVDGIGNVYVTETSYRYGGTYGYERIQVFDSSGNFIRKWGSYGSEDGQFGVPQTIAVDNDGYVYVADFENSRIQIFTNTGTFLDKWQRWENHNPQNKDLYQPYGITLDKNGNVYVNDNAVRGNPVVKVFDQNGNYLVTWGGDNTGDGQPKYSFGRPAFDDNGNVYILCSSYIQVFDKNGNFLRQWGSYGSGDGQLKYPIGIIIDDKGYVYVLDAGNKRIQVFDNNGNFFKKWGSHGTNDSQFSCPAGIGLDGEGNVYVSDVCTAKIQVFDNSGAFLRKWGNYGVGEGKFRSPYHIAVDNNGHVYVSDNTENTIQIFDKMGLFLKRIGSYGSKKGSFMSLDAIALNKSGTKVYVVDPRNYRIQVFEGYGSLIANAGPDQTVEQASPTGAYATLDASASKSGCTDAMTYEWTWSGGSANGIHPTVFMPTGMTLVTLKVRACGSSATATVKVTVQDTIKPSTTATLSGKKGLNDWFISDTTISLSAADSGSGVKEVHCSIDGGTDYVVSASLASFTITGEGIHTVIYYAVDNAGNVESAKIMTVKIDKTPPVLSLAPSLSIIWPPNHKLVDVVINGSASDAMSGVASVDISVVDEYGVYSMKVPEFGSIIQLEAWRDGNDMDGRRYTITVVVTDMAGNKSTATSEVLVPHDMRK